MTVKEFYEDSYGSLGFKAQRKYPNEELCRFMGRNFFDYPIKGRSDIKILETGCGSGANLWMIAKEGFDTYGIDLSENAIRLCKSMLDNYNTTATLSVADMTELDFVDDHFDAIVDVFSSNCMGRAQHGKYLSEVHRTLKPGGRFFSYFPSKNSDMFKYPGNAEFIDTDTLLSITREGSPFFGQNYPFRFLYPSEYRNEISKIGLHPEYIEIVYKSYRQRRELMEFVVIEGVKK